jgi:hypothetical protein
MGVVGGAVVSAALFFLPACQSGTATLVNSYSVRLMPIVGRGTRDDVAREFGLPSAKQSIGKSEVWEYRTSKGVVTGGNGSVLRPIYSHELFEKLTVMFDDAGILRSWSLETQDGLIGRG